MVRKISILVIIFSLLTSFLFSSCLGDVDQFPISSKDRLAPLLVPNTNLELYVYAKQDRPTIVPAKIINLSHDIKVDSLAIWGLPSDKGLVFGAGLTFTSASDAADTYVSINLERNDWKVLRENKVYVVKGAGAAAESLKAAILNNGFKYYTGGNVLEAVAMLPRAGRTKMVAIAVAKPSNQVLEFTAGYVGKKNLEQVTKVLKLLNPEVVIGGLYSPHQINIARAMDLFEKGTGVATLDVGMLILVKSALPGFVVSPAVKSTLREYGFVESVVGELVLYKGSWSAPDGATLPIIVRIDGNFIFAAISGQEAYAQTLITGIYK